jgi:hypothetical protein
MSRIYGSKTRPPSPKKKTRQGSGIYTKKAHAGGETFYESTQNRAGSTPSKFRRRKKPYRGQGR